MKQITLHHVNDAQQSISDLDLATLADWASDQKHLVESPAWKRAFALIREGADTLLRRRALTQDITKEKL